MQHICIYILYNRLLTRYFDCIYRPLNSLSACMCALIIIIMTKNGNVFLYLLRIAITIENLKDISRKFVSLPYASIKHNITLLRCWKLFTYS